jgi:hypothetical protein
MGYIELTERRATADRSKTSNQGERMKIKSIAAVGALSAGLGIAGFIGAGTAAAVPDPPPTCGESPTGFTAGNIICNVESQTGSFLQSIDPARNIGILINGENVADAGDPPKASGLGLRDQLGTFQGSLQDFAKGPQSPDGPSEPAP